MNQKSIILFDGVCNLCNGFIQKIIKADKKDAFRFAALQSEAAQELLKSYPEFQEIKTVVFIDGDKIYTRSSAAIRIATKLGGIWSLLRIGWIFPPFIRDGFYNWVSKNRYRWFGQKEQCMVPTPELQQKFL